MAEGDAAVHAARALLLELRVRIRQIDLVPVVQPLGHGPGRPLLALDLEEAGRLTHSSLRPARRTSARGPRRAHGPAPPARASRPSASPSRTAVAWRASWRGWWRRGPSACTSRAGR